MDTFRIKPICKYQTKNVEVANSLVSELYNELKEKSGGLLHIVLDDGNLTDEDLNWCVEYCNLPENSDRADKDICIEIAQSMLKMSIRERKLVYYGNGKNFCPGNCFGCVIADNGDDG